MRRQKRNGWKIVPLVEVILVGAIACTAIGSLATMPRTGKPAPATEPTVATEKAEEPTEQTEAATEQTEPAATVPTETQPETTATEAPVTLYDVPLSEELQLHIIQTSEAHDIDPAVVIGMIWRESSYKASTIGDRGNSLGLMQIQPKWHKPRMERLGCTDLMDPFQNVTVGIDFLAELLRKYDGNISMALMAYNAGAAGANRKWFSQGIYSNKYSEAVLNKAAKLETYQAKN